MARRASCGISYSEESFPTSPASTKPSPTSSENCADEEASPGADVGMTIGVSGYPVKYIKRSIPAKRNYPKTLGKYKEKIHEEKAAMGVKNPVAIIRDICEDHSKKSTNFVKNYEINPAGNTVTEIGNGFATTMIVKLAAACGVDDYEKTDKRGVTKRVGKASILIQKLICYGVKLHVDNHRPNSWHKLKDGQEHVFSCRRCTATEERSVTGWFGNLGSKMERKKA